MAVNTGITKLDAATTSYSAKTTVVGQPDVPGLSTAEMQETVEYMPRNFLLPKLNEVIDSLNSTYSAAETQQAINDKVTEIGSADMRKSQYDPDSVGYTFTDVKNNTSTLTWLNSSIVTPMRFVAVRLKADSWSSSAPYTQGVAVSGMTEGWVPGIPVWYSSEWITQEQIEALSCLSEIMSHDGWLAFFCMEEKPTIDLWVAVPGLVTDGNDWHSN